MKRSLPRRTNWSHWLSTCMAALAVSLDKPTLTADLLGCRRLLKGAGIVTSFLTLRKSNDICPNESWFIDPIEWCQVFVNTTMSIISISWIYASMVLHRSFIPKNKQNYQKIGSDPQNTEILRVLGSFQWISPCSRLPGSWTHGFLHSTLSLRTIVRRSLLSIFAPISHHFLLLQLLVVRSIFLSTSKNQSFLMLIASLPSSTTYRVLSAPRSTHNAPNAPPPKDFVHRRSETNSTGSARCSQTAR